MKRIQIIILSFLCAVTFFLPSSSAFAVYPQTVTVSPLGLSQSSPLVLKAQKKFDRFTKNRRQELGLPDDADEYDLDEALRNNTDPFISKVIAGSFILTMIILLVVAIVLPSLTDYGEGVCNPLLTGGRC
jgi:hypothetical protein